MAGAKTAVAPAANPSPFELFRVFLGLGLTSFGGPIAHLGYFRRAFVERRQWLSEAELADLIALCQILPGPTSSEVGIAIGAKMRGKSGALAAWLGFTLPSALLMIASGLAWERHGALVPPLVLHALSLVAVIVVAQALWAMARTLTPDWPRRGVALAVAAALLIRPEASTQTIALVLALLVGLAFGKTSSVPEGAGSPRAPSPLARAPTATARASLAALAALAAAVALAFLSPLVAATLKLAWLTRLASYFRVGLLVFGGGHVVLPLLQSAVVDTGWVEQSAFVAGYGAAQALPGPLFSFAAFLGAVDGAFAGSVTREIGGGLIALVGIFLPAFLLLSVALPYWRAIQTYGRAQSALASLNAAVVGLLAAALVNPLGRSSLLSLWDVVAVVLGLLALVRGRWPPIALVAIALSVALALNALGAH